jgi:plastocyanin
MKRLAAAVALALALVACGSSSQPKTPAEPAPVDMRAQAHVNVAAQNNQFTPKHVIVSPGTTVTWTNEDQVAHDVKKAADAVDFGGTFGVDVGKFGPGATYSFEFTKPGNFPYTCTIHGLMLGSVQVEA